MRKKKVMIVDDEKIFLSMVKSALELKDKYEVLTLSNTKGIIPNVYNFKPDIILLDLVISPIGGLQVCKVLSEDQNTQCIPIIIISALDQDLQNLKACNEAIVGYLMKPIQINTILSVVEKELRE